MPRAIPFATHDPKSTSGRATISIEREDLLRSMYVVGKTGTGKSALLEHLAVGAAAAGLGVAVIDPHGDMAERLLGLLPARLTNRIVRFAPKEQDLPVGLNLLAPEPGIDRAIVASQLVDVFRKLWGKELFGPRSEHVLRNGVLVLLENPGTTLVSLLRLLTDEAYRHRLLERVTDPVVLSFWQREFPALGRQLAAEVVAPVLNKLGALTAPAVRRVVGQISPRLRLRQVMDEGRVLIADLSGIGRDAMELLGGLLVAGLTLAARGRAGTPAAARRPFLLVADEFQGYTTAAFAELLSEARKYGLCATLAHQYGAQLHEGIRAAILGNVGTIVAFRVSADDAELLEPEFSPEITACDLTRLKRHRIVLKRERHGEPDLPILARTLPPDRPSLRQAEIVKRVSAERYGRPVALVDREIASALGFADRT